MYWWRVHTAATASADSPRSSPGWGWTGTVWPSWPSGRPRKAFWRSGRSCVALASCARLSGWRRALPHWHYPGLRTWSHTRQPHGNMHQKHREGQISRQRRTKTNRKNRERLINMLLQCVNEPLCLYKCTGNTNGLHREDGRLTWTCREQL